MGNRGPKLRIFCEPFPLLPHSLTLVTCISALIQPPCHTIRTQEGSLNRTGKAIDYDRSITIDSYIIIPYHPSFQSTYQALFRRYVVECLYNLEGHNGALRPGTPFA